MARDDLLGLVDVADTPSVPGMTGTPAAVIVVRASALSPISSICSGAGPMNVMSLAAHRRRTGVLGEEAVAGVDGVGAGDRPPR